MGTYRGDLPHSEYIEFGESSVQSQCMIEGQLRLVPASVASENGRHFPAPSASGVHT